VLCGAFAVAECFEVLARVFEERLLVPDFLDAVVLFLVLEGDVLDDDFLAGAVLEVDLCAVLEEDVFFWVEGLVVFFRAAADATRPLLNSKTDIRIVRLRD